MSGFSADWLALREPFDVAARDDALAARFLAAVPRGGMVVDLGAGAGSNIGRLRALAARDGRGFAWRHVDADQDLIAVARARFVGDASVGFLRCDLAAALDAALDGAAAATCAALIDLVSAAWIERLAALLAARRMPLLAVLTYDGRMEWSPADPADAAVARAFHRDMTRDKGFGRALGPEAAAGLADALRARGAAVALSPSDWRIGPADAAMLAAMQGGIAAAALAAAADEAEAIAAWSARRAVDLAAGRLSLVVGHQDLVATWP
jgi:SAM-dependent methyltransferase